MDRETRGLHAGTFCTAASIPTLLTGPDRQPAFVADRGGETAAHVEMKKDLLLSGVHVFMLVRLVSCHVAFRVIQ